MALYYFAESFKVYNNLAIALLTVTIAIFAIMIPYINQLKNKFSLDKVKLEKDKQKLKVDKVVERYNEIEGGLGNLGSLKFWLTASIIFYAIVIFFSAYFLGNGTYNCLDIQGCQNSPDKNFEPIWSIAQDANVLNITSKQFVEIVPFGFLISFVVLIWIIFKLHKITENVANIKLEQIKEGKS